MCFVYLQLLITLMTLVIYCFIGSIHYFFEKLLKTKTFIYTFLEIFGIKWFDSALFGVCIGFMDEKCPMRGLGNSR